MNFEDFFKLLKPHISWWDLKSCWYCEACGREMDKSEMELHWPKNCSLNKIKLLHKVRNEVIAANPELYAEYIGIKYCPSPKADTKEVPLSWYRKQIQNYAKLPMNLGEPSGARVDDVSCIPLRKLTAKDLIPKICKKKIIRTGDPIIDSIPMRDMPFRDIDGHILSYEKLDELEEQEKEAKKK